MLNESKIHNYKMDNNQLRHKMHRLDLESKIMSVGGGSYFPNTHISELSQYPYQKLTPSSANRIEFPQTEAGTAESRAAGEINSG